LPTSTPLVLCVFLLAGTGLLRAQVPLPTSVDVGITYISQHSLQASTSNGFWMEGGSAELGVDFTHGLGFAADYTVGHANSIAASGVPLDLGILAFGPRYRWHAKHRFSAYGEALFGYAHGWDSEFPIPDAPESSANSFALQVGAGLDYKVTPHIAVRAVDVGWLRTELPNGTDNIQNHLRVGAGVALVFGRK